MCVQRPQKQNKDKNKSRAWLIIVIVVIIIKHGCVVCVMTRPSRGMWRHVRLYFDDDAHRHLSRDGGQ